MERETGLEPATSSLGSHAYFESKSLARFCCEFLNLQRLAESAFSKAVIPNEARTRQGFARGIGTVFWPFPRLESNQTESDRRRRIPGTIQTRLKAIDGKKDAWAG